MPRKQRKTLIPPKPTKAVNKPLLSGGPTKELTVAIARAVATSIKQGNWLEVSAARAGIGLPTLRRWLERGTAALNTDNPDPDEVIYRDFVLLIDRAEADAEAKAVKNIVTAGEGDWKASAWYLTHRHKDRWAEQELTVDHNHTHTATVTHTVLSKEELASLPLEAKKRLLEMLRSKREQLLNPGMVPDDARPVPSVVLSSPPTFNAEGDTHDGTEGTPVPGRHGEVCGGPVVASEWLPDRFPPEGSGSGVDQPEGYLDAPEGCDQGG